MSAFTLSLNAKVYFSITALDKSTANPTPGSIDADAILAEVDPDDSWIENGNIRNLTLGLTKEEFDISTRGDGGWKLLVGTLMAAGINADMIWRPGDGSTGFDKILAAALVGGGELTLAIMDGDISVAGTQGLVANFNVMGGERSEELAGALTLKTTIKPSSYPDWWVVPA